MTGADALAYDRYQTGGAEEWLLRIGPGDGKPMLFLPPLLEEMNRTRALILGIMRVLAREGHACWLIDLPGTGESERALQDCSWSGWRDAVAAAASKVEFAAGAAPLLASLRGGALLDDAAGAAASWRFAPAAGASLVRDLERSSLVAPRDQDPNRLELAGYPLGAELLEPLRGAVPAAVTPLRVLRLESDPGEADRKLKGPALWRRSEPASAPELSALLASDLAEWSRQCGAC